MKKELLFTFSALIATTSCNIKKTDSEQIAGKKPMNIIYIMSDDHSYQTISAYDKRFIQTPNIDRLANEGVRFTNSFVANSISGPSRACILTGKHSHANGFTDNSSTFDGSQQTYPKLLQKAGYETAIIGKWHLTSAPTGFDYSEILIGQGIYYNAPFIKNGKQVPSKGYVTNVITEKAIDWMENIHDKNKPFCLLLHHKAPHRTWMPDTCDLQLFSDTTFELPANFYDDYNGRQAAHEQKKGLDKNTLVIFTSDNGPWLLCKQEGGSPGPLKDGKASMFEGGFRVPCIMWGAMVKPGYITDMASTLDLLPTFCEIAGIPLPSDRHYDGISLLNVLKDKSTCKRDVFYFYRGSELYAIRKGKYKAHFSYRPAYGATDKIVYDKPVLYDLGTDPGELYNIAEEHPDIVQELTMLANAHKASLKIAKSIFDQK